MFPVSARFERAMKESHTAVSKLEVERGDSLTTFNILEGSTTYDFDDTTRRSMDVVIIDELNRTYDQMEALTNPFISVLKPYRGIQFAVGDIEWVPMGTYYTHALDIIEKSGAVTWRIAGLDASSRAMTPVEHPFYVPSGTPIANAVPALIQSVVPGMNFAIAASPFVTPAVFITEDSNPWEEAEHLAWASGNDLFLSRVNVCTMGSRAREALEQNAVWEFIEGVNATFWEPTRTFQQRKPNVIVVIGTNPLAPTARGEAVDNDPMSPTYVYGPYGRQVEVVKSELVVDSTQATMFAQNILSRRLGPQDEITFSCVPNPALDESDTITMTRACMGMNRRSALISHIECPLLSGQEMHITARRSVTSEGRIV